MIQEGPDIKNRENSNCHQPTKSRLSLRPRLCSHRHLSLSSMGEPGVFLHLKFPGPFTDCILFSLGWSAKVREHGVRSLKSYS